MNHPVPDDTLEATGYLDSSGTVPGIDFDTHLHRRLFLPGTVKDPIGPPTMVNEEAADES